MQLPADDIPAERRKNSRCASDAGPVAELREYNHYQPRLGPVNDLCDWTVSLILQLSLFKLFARLSCISFRVTLIPLYKIDVGMAYLYAFFILLGVATLAAFRHRSKSQRLVSISKSTASSEGIATNSICRE